MNITIPSLGIFRLVAAILAVIILAVLVGAIQGGDKLFPFALLLLCIAAALG